MAYFYAEYWPVFAPALSPLNKVPVLEAGNAVVFESQVIAEYLDEITPGTLRPLDPLERARRLAWIEFGSETLNDIASLYNAPDETGFTHKATTLRGKFKRIEREKLSGRSFQAMNSI